MTLYGVDIHSQYQAGISIDRLKSEGYTFVVDKASEGTYIPSNKDMSPAAFKAQMLAWVTETRQLGLVPGLYHWLKSGNGIGQARFFHSLVVEAGGPEGMLIQLDDEDNASYQDTKDFAAEWTRLTGGHPLLIYTGAWWWGPRGWDGNAITPYLWHSHYLTADPDTISDDPAAFAARIPSSWWTPGYGGWPAATILQFTSQGDAGTLGNNVDLNVFRGTLEQLRALTTGGTMLKDEQLTLPEETLVTGELVPAKGGQEVVDAASAVAFALRHSYVARKVAEATLAEVQSLKTGGVDVDALAAALLPKLRDMVRAEARDAIADAEEAGAAAARAGQ